MLLWRSLERWPQWTGIRQTWAALIGDEFALLQPMLVPEATRARSVLLPGRVELCRVVEHAPNDIELVDDQDDVIIPATAVDLVLWTLPVLTIAHAIAEVWKLDGTPAVGVANSCWLGAWQPARGTSIPVFLVRSSGPEHLVSLASTITATASGPVVIVTLTGDHRTREFDEHLARSKSRHVSLDDCVVWTDDGGLRSISPLATLIPKMVPTPAPGRMIGAWFPTPSGTKWNKVEMQATFDPNSIHVRVGTATGELTPMSMELCNRRTGSPHKTWGTLVDIISANGKLSLPGGTLRHRHQKQCQLLSKRMTEYFRIDGPAIVVSGGVARSAFVVRPSR